MNPYIRLMRPEHWYKNILVFLALAFSNNLFNTYLFMKVLAGFSSLSLVSSSYYIINDIKDANTDKKHPEKKHRPVASGSVKKGSAILLSAALASSGLLGAYLLSSLFFLFALTLFATSNLYSFCLKNKPIVDIHVIAINFLLRAVSGAVLISVAISPWLVFSMFLVALFLAAGKRVADMKALGPAAKKIMPYAGYKEEFLRGALYISGATVIVAYGLYAFLAHPGGYMMVSLPFVSFMCLRFLHFALEGNKSARKAHLLFLDRQMFFALILWVVISFAALYVQA